MNAHKLIFSAMIAASAALAGCQSEPGPAPRAATLQQSGVEGEWLDQQGVAVSRFAGGVFESTATDTGNKLAEGTYRYQDQRTVDISMTSLIRQTRSSVACTLATPNRLNCTNSQGNRFTLTRRAGIS